MTTPATADSMHLTHLKTSEAELRRALHAVNTLAERLRDNGGDATPTELDGILSRLESAAVHLRAAREYASEPQGHPA